MAQRRIGILGGSFNPPHRGHLKMAETAHSRLKLDQVWLMVSPQNPLKLETDMAPLADRMAMCTLLAADKPWLTATDIESRLNTQFTADTLKQLTRQYPNDIFFWLMGDDNLKTFHKWHNWQDIAALAPLVVFRRSGDDAALISPAAEALKDHQVAPDSPTDSSTETPPSWRLMDNDPIPASATDARENVREKPANTAHILTPDVADYIKQNGLYAQKDLPEAAAHSKA